VHTDVVRSLLVVAALAACSKPEPPPPVDPGLVRLSDDRVLRTDSVGAGDFATRATFVLVDAENISDHELAITLGGDLIDANGAVVSHLRPESLRMPKGASRTFVLVDDASREQPAATDAKVFVRGAVAPTWSPTATLTDGHAFDDHGKTMVAANLTNMADRPGSVLVLAGFHDAAGHPVARSFDVVALDANQTKVVRFVGPPGSVTGAIWLGDANY
jgi:hypothetical protein